MLHRRQGYKNRGQLKATAGNVLTITGCFCSIFSVNNTIAGQNVSFFWGGGGVQLGRVNLGRSGGKPLENF